MLDVYNLDSYGEKIDNINATYSGADINVYITFPYNQNTNTDNVAENRIHHVGSIQTISISSRRTIDPVRALGITMPTEYTRGPRTIAGSLIFTDINYEYLAGLYSTFGNERYDGGLFIDQLKEFDIHIPCFAENGQTAYRFIHGVTIANYGTTYSIDNMLTESTYTYVAKWVSPLLPTYVKLDTVYDNLRKYLNYGYNQKASLLR